MRKTLGVVIANYNHGRYLRKCLEAVFSQSRPADQVVIIDDASTDDSWSIIQSFKDRPGFQVIRNEKNLGPVPTFHRGLSALNTDYFFGGAADDMVLPGFFEKCMQVFERWPEAGVVAAHPAYMNDFDETIDLYRRPISNVPKNSFIPPFQLKGLLEPDGLWIAGHASIANRIEFSRALEMGRALEWHWDWFGLHIVALRKGVYYIPEPLSALRVGHASYSTAAWKNPRAQADVMWNMCRILNTPAFDDVRETFISSGLVNHYSEYRQLMLDMLIPWGKSCENRYIPGQIFIRRLVRAFFDEMNALKVTMKARSKNSLSGRALAICRFVRSTFRPQTTNLLKPTSQVEGSLLTFDDDNLERDLEL